MDDGLGRDIPPDEERLNYVYANNSNGNQQLHANDLEEDSFISGQQPQFPISYGIQNRNGYCIQEPVDLSTDAAHSIYEEVFPAQRQTVPNVPDYFMSEENRLSTFSDWQYQHVIRKEDLARNGFIFTGTGDKVRCVYCNGILRQWEQGDVVAQEHQRNFPNCPLASGQNVGNIPFDPNSSAQHASGHLNTGNVAVFDARSCRRVNEGYDIDPIEDRYGASGRPAGSQINDHHKNDAAACKNNSTGSDLSPKRIYCKSPRNPLMAAEPDRLATFSSWPAQMKQKPDELAQAGLYYTGDGDRVKCFHCFGGLLDWEPDDDPFVEHARWFPNCQYIRLVKGENFVDNVQNGRRTQDDVMQTPSVLAVLHEGHSVDSVQRALAAMRKKDGANVVVTARNLLMTIMELEEDSTEDTNDTMPSEDLKKLQRENESLRDRQLCKICMERDVEVIFYPCRHFVCCAICSAAVQACPICRMTIEGIDKIFMV